MNIWEWVHAAERELAANGHGRLAELMRELPSAACDDRHEQVDALVPEALALAKGLDLPWIELFVRHWSLQSRVLHRMDATALGEALSLLDFAHAEATRDCPQAVCAVQDLAACYEHVDDVGYAEERLAVAREGLARIDPSWPCFECVSEELGGALNALGRHEEALAFLGEQERAAKALARRAFSGRFGTQATALLALGRAEEALSLVRARVRGETARHRIEEAALYESLALAALGRHEEASECLSRIREPLHTPAHYAHWGEAADTLVAAGALANDAGLGQLLASMLTRLDRQGIGRTLVVLAERALRLAVGRRSAALGASALATMERAATRLVEPEGMRERLDAARALLATLLTETAPLPESPEEVLAGLGRGAYPTIDEGYAALDAARKRWPEHEGLVVAYAKVATRLGVEDLAASALEAFCAATPHAVEALVALGVAHVGARNRASLDDVKARLEVCGEKDAALWLTAVWSLERGELDAARDATEALATHRPGDLSSRRMALQVARKQRDFPALLRWSRELVALGEEPGPVDWSRMIGGTVAEAWSDVRESAVRLGFDVEGEGPIDVNGGACRVRFDAGTRDARDLFALRTGPVTAQVLEIGGPERAEHYGERVVFDPEPLPGSEVEGPEGRPPVRLYAVLATLEPCAHRSFVVDGLHPGEDLVLRLRRALGDEGLVLQVVSGEGYQLPGEGEGAEPRRGLYAHLAVAEARPLSEVSARLTTLTAGLELTWLGLAEAAGDAALVNEQRALAERLGL